jgi:hypothetical protein
VSIHGYSSEEKSGEVRESGSPGVKNQFNLYYMCLDMILPLSFQTPRLPDSRTPGLPDILSHGPELAYRAR